MPNFIGKDIPRSELPYQPNQKLYQERIRGKEDRIAQAISRCLYHTDSRTPYSNRLSIVHGWATSRNSGEYKGITDPQTIESERVLLGDFFTAFNDIMCDILVSFDIDQDGITEKTKPDAARINQELARFFFFASYLEEDSPEFEIASSITSILDKLGDQHSGLKQKLNILLNGAKAQAGIMDHFHERGCFILSPTTEDEIKEWDCKQGIDFIAISPRGVVYLVDAKGKLRLEGRKEFRQIPSIEQRSRSEIDNNIAKRATHEALKRGAITFTNIRVRKCEITVPTSGNNLNPFGKLNSFIENQLSHQLSRID